MDNHQTTWLVISDATTCRFYHYQKTHLSLIKEIQHPENKRRDIDITNDKPGHYKTSSAARGAFSQETDPKEGQIDHFAREITKTLEHDHNQNAFEKLILVASPHMMGLLNKHLSSHLESAILRRIQKDLIHLDRANLLITIHNQLEL